MDLVPGGPPEPPIVLPEATLECDDAGECRPTIPGCEAIVDAALDTSDALLRALAVPAVRDADRMKELLKDPEGIVREAAAIEAGRRQSRGLLTALRRASRLDTGDSQGTARIAALDARIRLGDKPAIKALGGWLNSADETTRALAVGYASQHKAFRKELRRSAEKDPSTSVREFAQLGLAHLGDPEELKRIKDRWDYRTYRIHAKADPSGSRKRLRGIIKRAVEKSPPSQGGPSLDLWFIDTSAAAAALLSLGEPSGRAALHELLERTRASKSGMHALVLLQQLQEFAGPEDLGAAASWLKSSDPAIRVAAAVTCLRILREDNAQRGERP
jgi:HEAT repeat protein